MAVAWQLLDRGHSGAGSDLSYEKTWKTVQNPVLSRSNRSLKDACLVYHNNRWVLACSAFSEERSTIELYHSTDGVHWGNPIQVWDGTEDGWIGLCSPDLIRYNDEWMLTYNSWGDTTTERQNRFFYRASTDLIHFSAAQPLAHDLLAGEAVIDGALAHHAGTWFLACNRTAQKSTWIATAPHRTGPWQWIADGPLELHAAVTNQANGLIHENYQFLCIDHQWHLLTTDYRPHQPWLYRLKGDPNKLGDWHQWCDGRPPTIPGEIWNSIDVINAAALWDHREHDGYWYAVFGGKGLERADEFNGNAGRKPWPRGWNRLGLARSSDLAQWELPG